MRNLLFSLFIMTLFLACDQEGCESEGAIPECIQSKMDSKLLAIKKLDVNGEPHYWLNTGDLAFDGPEYIVNSTCDTVCMYCFCPPQPCHADYKDREWEVIWEK